MMIRKKLSIIVPYHNEPEKTIYDLFNSIEHQININFNDIEVIVSNNSLEPVKPKCFEEFSNINIKYIVCPIKNGVGSSRQFAIDNCCGKWCIICDCDDILYAPDTLSKIINDTETNDVDLIYYTEYIEESPNEYFAYGKNLVLVHGKAYNVDYLRLNNIRFHNYLLYGADVYFSLLIDGSFPRYLISETPIYVWRYNQSSVSHSEGFDTDFDKIESLKRTYIVYNKIKTFYCPDILTKLSKDIFGAFYQGWKIIDKFQQENKSELYLLGSQIIGLSIETLDPNHLCLSSDSIEDVDREKYQIFVEQSSEICKNLPKDFIERNQLWI